MTWEPKAHYPDLRNAMYIGVDVETCDPNLLTMGPGDRRNDGFIVGISLATNDGFKAYYPIAHQEGGNLPRESVISYLREQLSYNIPKVGANIGYDLGWLDHLGVKVAGPKICVQIADALIYELHTSYALNAVSERWLGVGKTEDLMREEAARRNIKPGKVKENIWKFHSKFVGPYAEDDAALAIKIWEKQKVKIEEMGLTELATLEFKLIDIIHAMRMKGIPISLDKAEQALAFMRKQEKDAQHRLNKLCGFELDTWSGKSIQVAFDNLGYKYPTTEKGNPSFTADWLRTQTHELAKDIVLVRQADRAGGTFIENKIINMSVNGRIHPNYTQTRRDDSGTVSGRFSSSNPNMQQVPARHPVLAPLIRGIFVPDAGQLFGVFDYSQQEPRITVHYAEKRGIESALKSGDMYRNDPATDYHSMVLDMMNSVSSVKYERRVAKDINLGLAYGMGKNKMAERLKMDLDSVSDVLLAYNQAVPFVREIGEFAMRAARHRGYIKTILGRRRHFPGGKFAHKALNAAVQGSSADMIKKAMVAVYDAGYLPYNTVHDELDFPISSDKEVAEIKEIMETVFDLTVPMKVDVKLGPSWGEAK